MAAMLFKPEFGPGPARRRSRRRVAASKRASRAKLAAIALPSFILAIYAANALWPAPDPAGVPRVLAHRGLFQHTRPKTADNNETCSARRMEPPSHPYLENTIASIRASFDAGAAATEVDVHPIQDGEFAVFHDDELDCRTDGKGSIRQHSLAYLKSLDAGYGYTADRGRSFPFRGKGVGMINSLNEVLQAFPDRTIVIDVKSKEASDAQRLLDYLTAANHATDGSLWIWAEGDARDRLKELAPEAHVISTGRAKACVAAYLATGWTGHVPQACRGATIFVPIDLRRAYWGWPKAFLDRMDRAGTEVVLTGPLGERDLGISRIEDLDAVPAGFSGVVMTDRIELIGPEIRRRWPDRRFAKL